MASTTPCPSCGKIISDGGYQCVYCAAVLPGAKPDRDLVGLVPTNTSGWAIAAGYCGLFSIVAIGAPFAMITGVIALRHLRKNPGLRGHVRAWFGIIAGIVGLVGYVVLGVVSAAR